MRARRSSRTPLLPGSGPLAKVPPAAVFAVVIVVFALGVFIRGTVGAALFALLAVGVLALLGATWSALRPAERALRVLVLVILVAVGFSLLR